MRHNVETPYGWFHVEVRFVIKTEKGFYFTEVQRSGTRDVSVNGVIYQEVLYLPKFEATHDRFAMHFDTEADAKSQMVNPLYGGPDAYSGCVVLPVE